MLVGVSIGRHDVEAVKIYGLVDVMRAVIGENAVHAVELCFAEAGAVEPIAVCETEGLLGRSINGAEHERCGEA